MKTLIQSLLLLFFSLLLSITAFAEGGTITGNVCYANAKLTVMRNSTVYLLNSQRNMVDSTITGGNGVYTFTNVVNGTYWLSLKPAYPVGGVTIVDALAAFNHYMGVGILTGAHFKSGDVNSSNNINAADAMLIQKRTVGLIHSFPAGDWVIDYASITVSSPGTYTINVLALCAGDVNASYTPDNTPYFYCGDTLLDSRDGQKYPTVQVGNRCWMKSNLNIGKFVHGMFDQTDDGAIEKYCYKSNPPNCDELGGLYQWDELMNYILSPNSQGICPSGWQIPSNQDWCTMVSFLDPNYPCSYFGYGAPNAGGSLKETGTKYWSTPNSGATNNSGFSGRGAGYRKDNTDFMGYNTTALFATSSLYQGNMITFSLLFNQQMIVRGNYNRSYGVSVRCIKNGG